jgi:hypothetical protein
MAIRGKNFTSRSQIEIRDAVANPLHESDKPNLRLWMRYSTGRSFKTVNFWKKRTTNRSI